MLGGLNSNGARRQRAVPTKVVPIFQGPIAKIICLPFFQDHFTERHQQSSLESTVFKGLLATGLAFGVLAGVMALR